MYYLNGAFEVAEKKLGQNTFIKENKNFNKTKLYVYNISLFTNNFTKNNFGGNNSLCIKRK